MSDDAALTTGHEEREPIALIVESPATAAGYLDTLEQRVGLRWVLTNNLEIFRLLLDDARDRIALVVLDFQSALTEKLKFYMHVVRTDPHVELPVLLLPAPETAQQARQMRERSLDQILERPFEPSDMERIMGSLMRRAERHEVTLRVEVLLQERTVEGTSNDLSATGMGAVVPDPILFANIVVRVHAPDESDHLDFDAVIRRKQRLPEGGYQLGIEFVRVREGDPARFGRKVDVDFSPLADAPPA